MVNLKYSCDAVLKDPFFNNSICGSAAKWKVKENGNDYVYLRCGRHSRNLDRIPLYEIKSQKKENFNINVNNNEKDDKEVFNLEELLMYIENNQYKKDIPDEIENLFKEIDNLNNNVENILK